MKKLREKYNLLTAIAICFAIYILLSWFIPTGSVTSGAYADSTTQPVGLFGLLYYPGITIGTFIQFGLIILLIGAFYGVMDKTGVYGTLVNNVSNKFKGKEKKCLAIIIVALTILSSITGLPYAIFIALPFLIGVLSKLGFNKITIVASTFGSILVGAVASTFGYTVAGMSSNILNLSITDGLLPRFALLAIVTFLFTLFVLGNKESKIIKNEKTDKKNNKEEVKEEILFVENTNVSKKSSFSLVLIFIVTMLISFISMFNWNTIFGFTVFEDFYEQVIGIKVSTYPIIENILGLTNPFGYWDSYELVALLLISSVLIGWVYNLKLVDILEGMKNGAKKVIRPAFYIMIANIVFALMLSSSDKSMLTFITDKLAGVSDTFNIFTTGLTAIIGAFLCNNYYYFFNTIVTDLVLHVDTEYYTILTFVLQSMFGIMMMILPTSLILVSGLGLLGVSFKKWIKYIWQFVLQLLVIILVIGIILILVV